MASRPTRLSLPVGDRLHRCASQKACYPTKAIALDAAEVMMEKGWVNLGCHITPYWCPDCEQWHVTNRQIVIDPR
jgi:hypothetical protein